MKIWVVVFLAVSLEAPARKGSRSSAMEAEAIVCALSGAVSARVGRHPARALALFERLPQGARIETGKASHVVLAFANGRRFELASKSRARVERGQLVASSGVMRALSPVSALPHLPRPASDEEVGGRAGAIRLRADSIRNLYPFPGSTSVADATVLRFDPVMAGLRYRIDVRADDGASIFALETEDTTVVVPRGTLAPGRRYVWQVAAVAPDGRSLQGRSELATLAEDAARARAEIRTAAERGDEASLWVLAAEVDYRLGLTREAREALEHVREAAPDDAAVARRVAFIDSLLKEAEP